MDNIVLIFILAGALVLLSKPLLADPREPVKAERPVTPAANSPAKSGWRRAS